MDDAAPARLDPARLDELWDFDDPAGSAERFRDRARRTRLRRGRGARDTAWRGHSGWPAARTRRSRCSTDWTPGILWSRSAPDSSGAASPNSAGDAAAAVPHFEQAFDEAVVAGEEFLAIDAAHMLAIADPDRAGEWAARGLELAASAADPRARRWGIALHNNLGWLHFDADRLQEALTEFELAAAAADAHGTDDQRQVAQWAIARCYRALGRTADAIRIQEVLAVQRPDDEYVQEELEALRHQP